MTTTDRATGPQIDGFTFIEHLGSGGYSDVYLYERRRPRMRVAVKVLTDARLSEAELEQFAAEAETMAELADHPYIVQVFTTGVTDDGRPYLVMKYYPPPNLGTRAATERFTVADVLRTGIQISSAVETAHRAGILHRDIKPANILVSSYGEPGLADFGIAGKAADAEVDDDLGVSIPWSPPEILSGASNGSVTSDVYSLAATLWHLLAGRSPFETPGGDNAPRALMGRILTSAPRSTGRADAPASLERLLQQAMAKRPEHRPSSAMEFARSLQMVEQELRYARTEILVEGAATPTPARPTPPSTIHDERFAQRPDTVAPQATPARESGHPATTVRPARPTPPPTRDEEGTRLRPATPAASATPAPRQRHGLSASTETPATVRRPATPGEAAKEPEADKASTRRGVKTPVVVLAAAVIVVAAVIIGIVVMSGGPKHPSANETPSGPVGTDQAGAADAADVTFPTVSSSYDAAARTLTFTWTPATGAGVTSKYAYWLKDVAHGGQDTTPTQTTQATARVRTTTPANECIEVGVVLTDGTIASNQQWTCGQ